MEVLINVGVGEIRVAQVLDGRLEDLSFQRTIGAEEGARGCHSLIGNIVLGRVQRVMPGMQAAFVEIGLERAGFLALREARALAGTPDADGISACVREGETVLVQIIKDAIGEKGARLSGAITLPGRLLVMTPGRPGLAVSRRVEDETQRAHLMALGAELPATEGGFIFRSAALGASAEELRRDAAGLMALWRETGRKAKAARPPATLYNDLGPIERTLRDLVRGPVTRVLLDDARAAEVARAYCRRAMPEAESMIALAEGDLFQRHGLEDQITVLSQPRVNLASGGWIAIETTEALTAIDVNSGSFTQSSSPEQTGLSVNLEAARALGRQIRLRGIGGLIVVDFIQLRDAANRAAVLAALEESLTFDHAAVQISPMVEFGIVAITRKRLREPLARLVSTACPACAGTGLLPTAQSIAMEILRRVTREAKAAPGRAITVSAAPDVVAWLEGHGAEIAQALAQRGLGAVRFAVGGRGREAFDVHAG